jgi:sigma-B regulation protein RsbU (phosphoserine phosphatase)
VLAVVYPNAEADNAMLLANILAELEDSCAVAAFVLPESADIARNMLANHSGKFMCVSDTAESAELSAKFDAAAELQPTIARLHQELETTGGMEGEDPALAKQFTEEMRLAARLQQDFLPRRLPEVDPVRFGVLFRPAGWVSGDIYDIIRLDETHLGFYVVDAVGHGMPAALLTMFIKKAMQTKRISGNTYEIVPPHVTLNELNIDICQQGLSSCQFCTAVYGVLDVETLELTYARAGHPLPLLVSRDGRVDSLAAEGSLLGVFSDQHFQSYTHQLTRGDRIVLYSDGAEETFRPDGLPKAINKPFAEIIRPWATMHRDQMLLQLAASIDIAFGRGDPPDDITVVVMDIEA